MKTQSKEQFIKQVMLLTTSTTQYTESTKDHKVLNQNQSQKYSET